MAKDVLFGDIARQKMVKGVNLLERLHKLGGNATNDQARAAFADMVEPLLELNKCPDLVINRGHTFGATLTDQDKLALIEFLKTF